MRPLHALKLVHRPVAHWRSSVQASGTLRATSAGSSCSTMNGDARKSELTSSSATSARPIAASISGRHSRPGPIALSTQTSSPSRRRSGSSIFTTRSIHAASARL